MAHSHHWLLPDSDYKSYAHYLAIHGSAIVERARGMESGEILGELKLSGLRGRGGAGFPTGAKWQSIASHSCPSRYVVCNAAEGEPGTFKDRYLLRHNPYAVLEGLLIAAHTVKAKAAYVAIKKSFRIEIQMLRQAIAEMAGAIAGLPIHIVPGPDEYLFGEEKALLEVIEDKEPLPRVPEEPPYEWGLFATPDSPNPTLVNNAETLAHVASILRYGGQSFRDIGTENTPGTILATLSGDIKRPGIYEVPAGTPLGEILHGFGGGPKRGRKFKAVLPGVSTGVIPEELFDTPADFDFLARIGSGLGSAGFIVIDDIASIPRVAQTVARFLFVESCDQCSACKNGLRLASESLDEIFDPTHATHDDIEAALTGAVSAPQGNRCYLPVQGAILIKSLMERYPHEFERQVRFADKSPAEWILPKMTDFDEKTRAFTYDLRQALKEPNWTYREESVL